MSTNPRLHRLGEFLSDRYPSLSPIEEPSQWLSTNINNIQSAWKDAFGVPSDDMVYLQRLIYPRLLAYTLGCLKFSPDLSFYIEFKNKLAQWNKFSPVTLLRSHRSIKETSWAFQNRCINNSSGNNVSPGGSLIKNLLRLDVLAIVVQILNTLNNNQLSRSFYDQRGPHAQILLDLLQNILDVPDFDLDIARSPILKILQQLSETSGLYPTSLILHGVEPQEQELEPVNTGPHGDIWKGTLAGNVVAIKVMKIDPTFISRGTKLFCKTAIVWRQLHHTNVVPFLGVCQWPGTTFRLCLVSPWMKHRNMIQYIQSTPDADIRSLLTDIAHGLNYLHSFDPPIIHGDLRGTNILVNSDRYACISDVGLSILARDSALQFTPSSKSYHSDNLLWLAPEFINQAEGQRVSPRRSMATDIYALGCVYYQAFTGHPRFVEMHDPFEIVNAVVNDFRPDRPTHEGLDDAIWDLMDMCWQKDATSRPTAEAVVQHFIFHPTATIDLRSPDETAFFLPPVVLKKSMMFQDIIIALVGPTGSGKSNFIHVATGDASALVGEDLGSCTQNVQAVSYRHSNGCNITFVDTPGFDDSEKTDFEVLEQITDWMKKTYQEQINLTGVLYFHRITDARMRQTPLRSLTMFEALCGKNALKNVVLTTTMWDQFASDEVTRLKEAREQQLYDGFWKTLLAEGCRARRFKNTPDSAWEIINMFITNSPRPLLVQQEMVDEDRKLNDTSAYKVLRRWWDRVVKKVTGRFRRTP